jgi:plastocyanin
VLVRVLTTCLVLLVATTVGCGDGSPAPTAEDAQQPGPQHGVDLSEATFTDLTEEDEVVVDARDNAFRQDYIEVRAGTTVTFRNIGRTEHNVLPVEDEAFALIEAEDLQPGDEADLTFDEAGEFPYYCSLHGTTTAGMVGAVRVVDEP